MPRHLKKASAVIAISQFVADQLVDFNVPASKIVVIPNGIQVERQPIAAPASNDLIVIARHDQNKNVPFVVRAFGRILELQPNWEGKLVIIGKQGRETQALLSAIKQLPQPEKVILVNGLDCHQLVQLLRQSLALVSASRMEGFDYPVLEAKAEGLPTLLSDIPVHREFHGDSSELFEINNDPSSLAEIAIRIANDYLSWRGLSLSGWRICNSLTLNGQQSSILKLLTND
jgi:glycosyltransferase involved in cell wall biosynthesis